MAYNSQWAKENISMPALLSCFGHEPVESRNNGRELWYISPFRYEKQPSFHTTNVGDKWIWNDFGRGDVKGSGTVIGFLELHENVDVSGALKILKNLFPNKGRAVSFESLKHTPLFKNISLAVPKTASDSPEDALVIKDIKDRILDKNLIGYLAGERKIDHRNAVKYLKQIEYENIKTGKTYHTLGFENDAGDFECRDKYFKGILKSPSSAHSKATKDISYIPGRSKDRIAVFEGFMDYLSVLTQKGTPVLAVDIIVLNMVNMRRRAIDFIKQEDYQEIYTFFDNDQSGEKTTQMFLDEPQLKGRVEPQNHLYKDHKDYNQYLQSSSFQRATG